MKTTLLLLAMTCVLCFSAGSSKAALTFFDDFDSYAPGLNWPGEGNWTVTEASVDLIGVGTAWDLQPGNGLYVDMDGTTGNAGAIESIALAMAPGSYTLSFDVAGNQRGAGDDSMNIQVAVGTLLNAVVTAGQDVPFTTISIPFAVPVLTLATISFDGVGGDNIGLLLDNVALDYDDGTTARVPVPGAFLLSSIGAGVVGWARRRRRS